jgi:hypothetical protein
MMVGCGTQWKGWALPLHDFSMEKKVINGHLHAIEISFAS